MQLSQEEFNKAVAENLVKYRKFNKFTQASLAEKLNYSDKAVSKWESGECLPDCFVMKQIADIYGVTVNDLLSPRAKVKAPLSRLKAFFVPALSATIVWIVALLAFVILKIALVNPERAWLSFIVAIPVTCIVVLVFACVYKMPLIQFLSITGIIWTTLLSVHLILKGVQDGIIFFYYVGIPVEVMAILWYGYRYLIKKRNKQK